MNLLKKVTALLCIYGLCLCCGCGAEKAKKTDTNLDSSVKLSESPKSAVDVDLTAMSSTMVYSEVSNIMNNPDSYVGKKIRTKGLYGPSYYDGTKKYYHYVVISDATACCKQGLEFVWEGEHKYPDDYPKEGTEIEVEGVYDTYEEDGIKYYYIDVKEIKTL